MKQYGPKAFIIKMGKTFQAYITFRCINNRTAVEKPNFDGMCSDEFSAESWATRTGTKMVEKPQKPQKPVKKKEEAPEEEVRSNKINARRRSTGMIRIQYTR